MDERILRLSWKLIAATSLDLPIKQNYCMHKQCLWKG
nr:MAG TPA: hypothetical protein [Caudoviricetes sp.]